MQFFRKFLIFGFRYGSWLPVFLKLAFSDRQQLDINFYQLRRFFRVPFFSRKFYDHPTQQPIISWKGKTWETGLKAVYSIR